MLSKDLFVHHVYFWLENPESVADRDALLEGLKNILSTVPTIQQFHIGVPAATNRDVIDRSYGCSWLALFADAEDQASYQTDPIHLHFIDTCKHLWKEVVVYDSIEA